MESTNASGPDAAGASGAESLARLLRLRAASEPLRIDVAGTSMGRTIVSGSSVWVSAATRPHWGEIWAYCNATGHIEVHRSVGRRGGRHRFWGDGNPNADELVTDERLIGRVIAVEPPGGGSRPLNRYAQLGRACAVGLRRLPRRLWYKSREFVRNVTRGRTP